MASLQLDEIFSLLLETLEIVRRLPANYSAETQFKQLDDDGDGRVSWVEFENHA